MVMIEKVATSKEKLSRWVVRAKNGIELNIVDRLVRLKIATKMEGCGVPTLAGARSICGNVDLPTNDVSQCVNLWSPTPSRRGSSLVPTRVILARVIHDVRSAVAHAPTTLRNFVLEVDMIHTIKL